MYSYNANTAYFDGIQLYRDGFGYKYEYDSENQVISILSPSKEKDRYEYQNNNLTREILHTGSELTYTYDDYHNVLTATTDEGLCYHFTYDTYGNNTAVSITKGSETMSAEATFSSDGNFPVTESDTVGNVTTYHYNSDTSVLEWVQNPNDTEDTRTEYTYDSMYRPLTVTAETDDGEELSVGYTFDTRDYLNTVTSQSASYDLNSGIFGLRTSVSIENRTLAAYTYSNDRNHYLTGMTYGNGDFIAYTRDNEGRITEEAFEDGETVEYFYDNDGALIKTVDSESGTTETEGYDFIGRVNTYEKTNSDIAMSLTYGYDESKNRITSIRDVYNGHSRGITYLYDEDNRVTRFQQARGFRYYTYDGFERIASYETKFKRASDNQFFTALTTSYDYVSPEEGKTSTFVKSVTQEGLNWSDTFEYTYDGNGNILSVLDGTYTTSYVYNSANELIRENNEKIGKTYTWEYDNAGNILNKKTYSFTEGPVSEIDLIIIDFYEYTNQDWGDLLTEYNHNTITYDEIGNPLSDGTWSYTWEHGRELSEMTDGESDWHFTYDANGLRTKRTDGTTTYTYAYVDGHLNYMEVNGAPYYITYAADGTAMGIVENDVPYYFETNQQGDVIGIVTYMGAKVVEYTYDAWGNLISCTGSRANTIGKNNPIRYRGYVYDAETGLYYVSSRYYDPEVRRFISPDTTDVLTATPGALTDKNLYAYCDNNPVIRKDDGGQFWNIIVGASIGGALELVGQLLSGKSLSEVNWAKVGVSAISGGLTAAVGPVAGCLISRATDVAMDALDGNIHSATDIAKSFALGTAKAAVSYGVGTAVGKATKSLTKIEKVGRIGDGGFFGVKYSYNKGQGRAVRSIEIHPNHNNHGVHLQGNKWNPKTGTRSGVFSERHYGGDSCIAFILKLMNLY